MHQHLKLPRLRPIIPHQHTRPQRPPRQRNRVNQPKLPLPRLSCLSTQVLGPEPEIELHTAVAALAVGFGSGLAEELPARCAREAVLGEGGGGGVVGGFAEDLGGGMLTLILSSVSGSD